MEYVVLISAVLIGLSLGLFGSGGAILTLPALMYLLGYDEKLAVISSLVIVGCIAFISSIPHWYKGNVSAYHLFYFAIPGLGLSYFGAYVGSNASSWLQLTIFVLLMVLAATKILLVQGHDVDPAKTQSPLKLSIAGLIVGFMTGFIGVGGGFLIVPALLFLAKLDLQRATATSLSIISIQSVLGLVSYHEYSNDVFNQLNWLHLSVFSGLGVLGSLMGSGIKTRLNPERLTKIFAYFLLVMASFIFADKLFL